MSCCMRAVLPWMRCSARSARLRWTSLRSSAVNSEYLLPRSLSWLSIDDLASSTSSFEVAVRRSHTASPSFLPSRSALYFWLHPALSTVNPASDTTAIIFMYRFMGRVLLIGPGSGDLVACATELEGEHDLADAAQDGTDADPQDEQPGRAEGRADGPHADGGLEDARGQQEAPQRERAATGDAQDDVHHPLEQQVPADEHREDAERLEGSGQRHEAGDEEGDAEHHPQPLPVVDV